MMPKPSATFCSAYVATHRFSRRLPIVLIIEGDEANRRLAVESLNESRFAPMTAATGRAGMEMARMFAPDIILLDTQLPDMTANEAMSLLRNNSRTSAIPVVATTSQPDPSDLPNLCLAGFVMLLCKPLPASRLSDHLSAAITFHAARSGFSGN